MKCPKCNKELPKVGNQVTNNLKTGKEYKEYDKEIYQCQDDDIWVTIETPLIEKL